MEEEIKLGEIDTLNDEETYEPETVVDTNDEDADEDAETLDTLKERLAKAEELAKNYKIRAEKAEKKSPGQKHVQASNKDEISSVDMLSLLKADVDITDIDDIKDYAKLKNLSISDALKTGFVKSMLADKAEQRRIASAAHVGSARRGTGKLSDDSLLENARKGIAPETDEDFARLVAARNKR